MSQDIEERHRAEIRYWENSPEERADVDSIPNIINKVSDAAVFLAAYERYAQVFKVSQRIVELGAGQGWASCLVKRLNSSAHVTATDIAPGAIASMEKWRRIWGACADESYACKSYETREPAESVDLVFCFASAHHFADQKATLAELRRILKPGGTALFLYEPITPAFLYPLARWRVNRIRPEVPEDLIVASRFARDARDHGLRVRFDRFPSTEKRRLLALLYYSVLKALPALQRVLPCTANIVIEKQTLR